MSEQTAGRKLIAEAAVLCGRNMHAQRGLTIGEQNRVYSILEADLPEWVERAEQAEAELERMREALEMAACSDEGFCPVCGGADGNHLDCTCYIGSALNPRATDGSGEPYESFAASQGANFDEPFDGEPA